MLERLKHLPELIALPVLIVIGLIFFALTDPTSLPPVALILGFFILTAILYSTLRLVMKITGLRERLSRKQYRILIGSLTTLPILLLALQSIGQLTVRDIITLVVLFIAGVFYASRMT